MRQPPPTDEARRVALALAVRDTDAISKVPDAGAVVERDGRRLQVMHNGVVVEEGCYGGAFMTEIIAGLGGHHEPQEEVVFDAVIRRVSATDGTPAMLELGSFWAYYSLWFLRECPDGRAVLVEPDPNNLEVGRRNFELNGVSGSFVQAAVGSPHGGAVAIATESDGVVRRVPLATVEGLMTDHGISELDVLLCDVQGAELGMLADSKALFASGRVRFLVLSTHHHVFSGDPLCHQRALEILEQTGATIVAEHSIPESCSGDGLIVAAFQDRDRDFRVPVSHVRARDSLFGELEYELDKATRYTRPVKRIARRAVTAVKARRSGR